MKKQSIIFAALVALVFVPQVASAAGYGEAGFWLGLWQGLTLPFRLVLKLVWTDITIYEQFDGTYWYHVGYLIGFMGIIGGGSQARS